MQHPDDRISVAQDAVFRVQTTIVRAMPESKEKTVTARILVFTNQIGCLLGKGGSIKAEMRKITGAYIRILGKDQIPKCVLENEEVVQVWLHVLTTYVFELNVLLLCIYECFRSFKP